MKGVVFTEFLEMVEDVFSLDMADHLITATNPPSGGAYTAVGTYDHQELVKMVVELSAKSEMPVPDLLKTFGRHLFGRFVVGYPQFFEGVENSFDFMERVHDYIHVEVRKLYPDAELPHFTAERPDGKLTLVYESPRALADFGQGLMEGCCQHFKEEITIAQEDLSEGKGTKVRFSLSMA